MAPAGPVDPATPCPLVLVVEDDPDVRDSLVEILTDEGWRSIGARHGAHALSLLLDGMRPCVILLDLVMPVMDGATFRAEQARDPRRAGIPVFLCSAHHEVGTLAADLDAAATFPKPIDLTLLLDKLAEVCPPEPPCGAGHAISVG